MNFWSPGLYIFSHIGDQEGSISDPDKWVQATAGGNPTVSSDLILILGCMTSNLLVLELFHLIVFCIL